MDSDEEAYLRSKLRNKGKSQTYLLRPDVLELKERTRSRGKCLGAAKQVLAADRRARMEVEASQMPKQYANISKEVWCLVAKYIPPEEVKRFALICKQSAAATRSRDFWLQLYRKYCQHSNEKNKLSSELPPRLQINELTECDVKSLRRRVIQALFYCHTPFLQWRKSYKLQKLVGRYYMSSWHFKLSENIWVMCYKFSMGNDNYCGGDSAESAAVASVASAKEEVVQDWEYLLEESGQESSTANRSENCVSPETISLRGDDEGDILFYIVSNRLIRFPSEFLYANSMSSIRLAATREKFVAQNKTINLDMDLVSSTGNQGVTLKYNQVIKWKVLPWWHPDFEQFLKCTFGNWQMYKKLGI